VCGVGILDRLGVNCVTDGLHFCAFTCDVCIWCNDMAAERSADLYAITLDDSGSAYLHMLEVTYDLDFVFYCFCC
jgi:hypothetical protein